MRPGVTASLAATLAASLLALACSPKDGVRQAQGGQQVVARIDDQVITVADLEERINRLDPFARARYSTAEQKRHFLEELVKFEVMAKEARARGYDRDPDVQRVLKNHLIRLMLQREVDDKLKPEAIPEGELKSYYDANLDRFRRPEEVRVSQIFTTSEATAQKAAAEARGARADKAFRALVDRYSEDEDSKMRGGDLTFFDRSNTTLPRALVDGAFALHEVGDVSPPVKSDKGWHVLKLTQRRPGFTRPFDEVKNDIRLRIVSDTREKRIEEMNADIRKRLKVEVYEDQLAKVKVAGRTP